MMNNIIDENTLKKIIDSLHELLSDRRDVILEGHVELVAEGSPTDLEAIDWDYIYLEDLHLRFFSGVILEIVTDVLNIENIDESSLSPYLQKIAEGLIGKKIFCEGELAYNISYIPDDYRGDILEYDDEEVVAEIRVLEVEYDDKKDILRIKKAKLEDIYM